MSSKRPAAPPPRIPGFSYVSLLGSGGFSDVYLYEQDRPRRKVAVKVLLSGLKTEGARRRFESEANLMAQLSSHPFIVTIFEAEVTEDGHSYLAMEYCSRPSLDVRYRRQRFSVDEVLAVGIQVASAVETAHRAGIAHRDIKPANILVTDYNRPALTDFGISGTLGGDADEDAGMSIPWSPPEQFRRRQRRRRDGGRVGPRRHAVHPARRTLAVRAAGGRQLPARTDLAHHQHARPAARPGRRAGIAGTGAGHGDGQVAVLPLFVGPRFRPGAAADPGRAQPVRHALRGPGGAPAGGRPPRRRRRGNPRPQRRRHRPRQDGQRPDLPGPDRPLDRGPSALRRSAASRRPHRGRPGAASGRRRAALPAPGTAAARRRRLGRRQRSSGAASPRPPRTSPQTDATCRADHGKRNLWLAISGGTLLVLAVIVGIVVASSAPQPQVPAQRTGQQAARGCPGRRVRAGRREAGGQRGRAGKVRFTWTNPQPKAGDTYKWRIKTVKGGGSYLSTSATARGCDRQPDRTHLRPGDHRPQRRLRVPGGRGLHRLPDGSSRLKPTSEHNAQRGDTETWEIWP